MHTLPHPLQAWFKAHPEFKKGRDARRVFGVSFPFLFRVLAGTARPRPLRAKEWEVITGIPSDTFLFFNSHGRHKKAAQGPPPLAVWRKVEIDGMTPSEFVFQTVMQRKGITVEFIGRNGKRFPLDSGTSYQPDFHQPGSTIYYEVSASHPAFHANKHKYAEFRERYPHLTLHIVKPDGSPMEVSA